MRGWATCDYDCIVWESEQLITHDVHHDGAHRVVRYEEASMHHCRVILLDATRYERDQHQVAICTRKGADERAYKSTLSSPRQKKKKGGG